MRTQYSHLSDNELLSVADCSLSSDPLLIELRGRFTATLQTCGELDARISDLSKGVKQANNILSGLVP